MSKVCMISGKSFNSAKNVSHSNVHTNRRQEANLQWKRFWLPEENRFVKLRVCTKVMKTIAKHGLLSTVKRYNADLAVLKG